MKIQSQLVDTALAGLWRINMADGAFLDVNETAVSLLGYSDRQTMLANGRLSDVLPPKQFQKAIERLQKTGEIRGVEFKYKGLDGRWQHVSVSAEYDPEVNCVEGFMIDISNRPDIAERKRAEERLSLLQAANLAFSHSLDLATVLDLLLDFLSQLIPYDTAHVMLLEEENKMTLRASRTQTMIAAGPAIGFTLDSEENPIINALVTSRSSMLIDDTRPHPDWTPTKGEEEVRNWIGVPLVAWGKVIGLYSIDKFEPNYFTAEHLLFAESLASQAAVAVQNALLFQQAQEYASTLENRVAEATAEIGRHVEKLAVLYEVGKEITAALELKSALQTIVAAAAHLVNADKSLILLLNENNSGLEEVVGHGYAPDILQSLTYTEFRHGISHWVVKNKKPTLSDDIRTDRRNRGLALQSAQAGEDKSVAIAPLIIDDQVLGTLTAVNGRRDPVFSQEDLNLVTMLADQAAIAIQNARLYEAAQEADRLKSAFLASMSHELRTPLNSIIGFTGIILQELPGPLNDEQKKQLGMVRTSARHLLSLINDVLDISKIEAGQLDIAKERFHLGEVIHKVSDAIAPQVEAKGLALNVYIDPQVGEIVSDQRRVEQILLNLVNNAVKFTEKGKVDIHCTLLNNGDAIIMVADTGIGIKPENQETLFQPFRQIDSGTTRKYEGTGLGLSICQRLCSMLGGNIWVESEWGKGSVFTFTLPIAPNETE